MEIFVNGEARRVDDGLTAATLVQQLEIGEQRFAMEINQEIVLRSELDAQVLSAGDRIEIVQAIGGG